MTRPYDPCLAVIARRETIGTYEIVAILNGYGDLSVTVEDLSADPEIDTDRFPFSSSNFLTARRWAEVRS